MWFKTVNLQCVFGHQDFNTRVKIKKTYQANPPLEMYGFRLTRWWENHASTILETWFWKPRWLRTQPSLRFRTSKFWYKNQIKNFSNEPFSTFIELSTDTLMGETKRVAMQTIKFEDSVKSVSKSVSGTLGQSGFWCKKENRFFIRLICDNSKKNRMKSWCNKSNLKFPRKWS